jgi:hypothetical protein
MIKWKIYYADGTTFSSEDGEPASAPAIGVQCVVVPADDVGRMVLCGFDYYSYHKGNWSGHDIFGMFQYLIGPGWKRVLFGQVIPSEEFKKIYDVAVSDPDFARKSGFRRNERRP